MAFSYNNHPFNNNILRLIDANLNRALEGIRILEETSRMLFNDCELTIKIKDIRHSLAQIFKEEKSLDRLMLFARGSENDILREGETESEKTRNDIISIVRANASRAQEAVRALEEYIKLSAPNLSEQFKKVRFNLYDIEKALVSRIHIHESVNKSRLGLCVVIDNDMIKGKDIYEITRAVLGGGAGTVIYGDKTSTDSDFMKNAEFMLSACDDKEVTTLIENRLDIAMVIHADGVTVGYQDIPVKACRRIAGQSFVLGLSVIIDKSIPDKIDNKADFYIVRSVSGGEKNKQNYIKAISDFVSLSNVPVLFAGEITIDTIKSVLDCGVTGAVLNPDFSHSKKIIPELENYKKIIETYRAKA